MTQRRAIDRRARILDAAFHVFSRVGYRDGQVDQIARHAATSKGGIYFHFPTKEALFLQLLRATADRLVAKVERAVAQEADPIAQADAALNTVLSTFGRHRPMAHLLLIDAIGAGPVFRAELATLHERFRRLIAGYLDRAVEERLIAPLDTRTTAAAWFGALHEIVMRWLMDERSGRLRDVYPTLREILMRSVGVPEARIAALSGSRPDRHRPLPTH